MYCKWNAFLYHNILCTGAGGSNEQSVDGISTSENLLDIGSQAAAIENAGNWWACPVPPSAPPMYQGQYGKLFKSKCNI